MADKLSIGNEMVQFDRRNRGFYDELTPEECKKFSTYLMLKWGANVEGSADLAGYYLIAVNENVNKHFFELGKHPKLQWLLCTTINPVKGTHKHFWINAPKKGGASRNKLRKAVAEREPCMRDDELDLLFEINTDEDIKEWLVLHGMTDQELKSLTK